ncbi:nucleotide exchange factor GrpE [Desmospora profundinema]|uniref:Protein GrpE n=1 Tax=Desmospora profundinema TaxID=1571184 RepID=A0ABU1IJV1_9BACL|nr:nucleotide exchange factor GrpE [Desmospora profundinema]MDR6225065.1 molecular chaperone GrpE [Desmospora profundinema]
MTAQDPNQGDYRPRTARELRKMKEAEERRKVEEEAAKAQEQGETAPLHSQEEVPTPPPQAPQAEAPGSVHANEVPGPVPATDPEELRQLREQTEALQKEAEENRQLTEELKKRMEEAQEQVLRARADLENFRRRSRKDREEAVKYAAVPMLESLLPVLDNLERALAAGGSNGDDSLHQGVEMVYRQLIQSLENHGLSVIEAKGLPFNPHEHNAVMEVEAEGVEAGTVVEELQKGYRYHDRVIRPSMVKVSS